MRPRPHGAAAAPRRSWDSAPRRSTKEPRVAIKIRVNGTEHSTEADADTPLLYVLRNDLELRGPKFGCGLAQCGACSVLVDGKEIRSCVTPIAAVEGRRVTTLEGLAAWYAEQNGLASVPALHPLQQAWIDEQVPQCGYCQSGMIVMAADLLSENGDPSDTEIKEAMGPHLCRCATHNAIVRAIKRAAGTAT
ncbi:MAG: (2Fe-2S)-binding protein [Thermoleophilia bacterium]|nr:(2Fe-2S)-binding protein [Thermoleophilia bacterium]